MWTNIIGWSLSVSIAIIGWWIAITNLNKQHRRNLELDNQKFVRDMQIKTADEAIRLLTKSRESLGELNLYLMLLPGDLRMKYAVDFDITINRWEKPNEQILQLWDNSSRAILEFTYFFESREVVLNQFTEMKQVYLDQLGEIRKIVSMYSEYLGTIYYSKYLSGEVLSEEEMSIFETKTNEFNEYVYDFLAYIHDFIVELQNTFWSNSFGYSIPVRQPTDPKYKVLRVK
ncbi:hypothetical protein J25TS5_01900 [Paenibacillus faecis]|uniref:hypothetical protein n=1 Tax=Paenibacillus faecis TaxID=862114 RepID=UPI001B117E7B|nr:hypothetical protein [Paenibacillus faecis]GIO83258.1 hypothetical protein J25TS5_01900 [Paenibacillus faecis]